MHLTNRKLISTVNIVKIDKKIDWLSITVTGDRNWRDFLPFRQLKPEGKGRHGYGQRWRDIETGAQIETAAFREDMGTHFTLSGDVLEALRQEHGMTDDGMAQHMKNWGVKCSRIDLAIDCFGANFNPGILNDDLENGCAKIRARTWRYIVGHRSSDTGDTIDTGSPKSDVRFRFYDKRAEQRIKDGEAWVRLELQCRRMYARAAISACQDGTVSGAVSSAIGTYLKWSHTDYQTALAGDTSDMAPISRKVPNRQKWLLGQVARALASEVTLDPGFQERFDMMVNYWKEKIDNQVDNQNE